MTGRKLFPIVATIAINGAAAAQTTSPAGGAVAQPVSPSAETAPPPNGAAVAQPAPSAAGAVARTATPVRIDFEAHANCSSVDAFYQGVRARTERVRPALTGETALQIHVRLFRIGTTIRGELKFGDQPGESETRRVDGLSCNEVVEALSLTAALALDPSASLLTGNTGDSLSGSYELPYSRAIEPPARSAPEPQPVPSHTKSSERVDLFAHASVTRYLSPGLDSGVEFGGRALFGKFAALHPALAVQGFYLSSDVISRSQSSSFRLAGAKFSLCLWHSSLDYPLDLGVCGAGTAAWLGAKGQALDHPNSVGRTFWALGLSSTIALRVSDPWSVEFGAGLAIPLLRREFVTTDPDRNVGKTPILSPEVGLGLAYRF